MVVFTSLNCQSVHCSVLDGNFRGVPERAEEQPRIPPQSWRPQTWTAEESPKNQVKGGKAHGESAKV